MLDGYEHIKNDYLLTLIRFCPMVKDTKAFPIMTGASLFQSCIKNSNLDNMGLIRWFYLMGKVNMLTFEPLKCPIFSDNNFFCALKILPTSLNLISHFSKLPLY